MDLRGVDSDPRAVRYWSGDLQAVIEVSVRPGRTNRRFPLAPDSLDPHVLAVSRALLLESTDEQAATILETLALAGALVQPKNAAEAVGLSDEQAPQLAAFPAWAEVFAWSLRDAATKYKDFPRRVARNRRQHGLPVDNMDPDQIMRLNDSLAVKESHAQQYVRLCASIDKDGFRPDADAKKPEHIQAEILLDGDRWCWKPGNDGNYRSAVLAALRYESLPVQVTKIIDRADVAHWPNVMNGLYSVSAALTCFEAYLAAAPLPCYSGWISEIGHSESAGQGPTGLSREHRWWSDSRCFEGRKCSSPASGRRVFRHPIGERARPLHVRGDFVTIG